MAALRAGVDAQLLVAERGAQFRFRHALTRDAVLDDLLPAERGLVSRAVLDAVEAAHPALPGQWCEVAAGLAERSGQHERAAALLLELARRSLAAGALGSAEQILDRARTATTDAALEADIDEVAAEVLALAGKTDQAIVVGSRVAHQLRMIDGPATRRTNAHLGVARAAVTAWVWDIADEHLARARECAADAADDDLSARVDTVAAQSALGQGRAGCRAAAGRTSPRDGRGARRPRARVRGARGHRPLLAAQRRRRERAGLRPRARDRGDARPGVVAHPGDERAGLARHPDRWRATSGCGSAHELALACGAWAIAAHLELAYGQWYLLRFRMDESIARLRRCAVLAERFGMPVLLAIAHASELLVQAVLGRADARRAVGSGGQGGGQRRAGDERHGAGRARHAGAGRGGPRHGRATYSRARTRSSPACRPPRRTRPGASACCCPCTTRPAPRRRPRWWLRPTPPTRR